MSVDVSGTPRSRIEEGKARITIAIVWRMCSLPGDPNPGGLCNSPFREDRTPSFSISEDGRYWKDFGTCEGGDVIGFLAKAKGIHDAEAFVLFLKIIGESSGDAGQATAAATKRSRPPLVIKGLESCTDEDVERISKLRLIPGEGLQIAIERRLLFACNNEFQGRCFVITDDARRNAICRRLDGKRFHSRSGDEGPKSKCWKGAQANWPIGIAQTSGYRSIALCEGMPDLLAAFWLAYAGGVESLVAPVAMTSASCNVHADALPLFRGKRVRIFGHADDAGRPAVIRWAQQLQSVQAEVDQFRLSGLVRGDDQPVKDLNDFILADHQKSGCSPALIAGVFDFAYERNAQ